MEKKFGEYIKNKRLEKGISLRQMAGKLDITPSYLSDIEKDRRYAPDKEKILTIARILDIHSQELDLLFELAGKSKDTVPPDLPQYIKENKVVRTLLRTAKKNNASDEELKELIKILQKNKR
ncbi:helix-turn-helix domain-containing protein [Wukongibacter sp. M2B1]|uniref:helix-turn-helix domain-containing protein n=1 Tax=Wukongibacter sp. M2B1 TaxID=3088895 RepID=UPI003D78E252